jgi:hypothetical protein
MAIKELARLFQFASLRVPHSPGVIEYPLEVMEEIRAFACDELLQLSHSGNEVGGVLFGTRREDLIRILTWRPIACEHTQGESLVLSSNDRMNLAVQLELARQNADLKDLRPLGCFVSHLQDNVSLSASDLEIYNDFFPEAWQVALVICPTGGGRARAGFFVREADGKLQADASYHCFDLQPLQPAFTAATVSQPDAGLPGRAQIPQGLPSVNLPADVQAFIASVAPQAGGHSAMAKPAPPADPISHVEPNEPAWPMPEIPATALQSPSFQTEERLPTHERWLWAIPVVLALGVAAFMLFQRGSPSTNTIALRASNDAHTVQLAWDANSRAIRDSYRGEIQINDGGKDSQISLSRDQLRAGKMSYLPQSGDIGFEITVYSSSGDPIHDSTRFIAPVFNAPTEPPQLLPASPRTASPPSTVPAAQPPAEQSELGQEVQQLKQELSKERARADELQNLVRILENRLGIQSAAPKPEKAP